MDKMESSNILNNISRVECNIDKYIINQKRPTVVVVTKNRSLEIIKQAIPHLDKPILGENRVKEALDKIKSYEKEELKPVKWHFIGHLQTAKVKKIIGKFELIHSIDSLKLVNEINKHSRRAELITKGLIEVDICQDGSKFGVQPEEVVDFLTHLKEYNNIQICGLMAIAPHISTEDTRPYFKRVKKIFEEVKNNKSLPNNVKMETLSTGMTNDYIVAIQEGSTMIRVGTAIFKS